MDEKLRVNIHTDGQESEHHLTVDFDFTPGERVGNHYLTREDAALELGRRVTNGEVNIRRYTFNPALDQGVYELAVRQAIRPRSE